MIHTNFPSCLVLRQKQSCKHHWLAGKTWASVHPRLSVEERYATRDRYLGMINDATAALVKDGTLLADDVTLVVKRGADHWNLVMGSATTSSR